MLLWHNDALSKKLTAESTSREYGQDEMQSRRPGVRRRPPARPGGRRSGTRQGTAAVASAVASAVAGDSAAAAAVQQGPGAGEIGRPWGQRSGWPRKAQT
jgi:hypothetical protein